MDFTGKITNVSMDYFSNNVQVTFSVNEKIAVNEIENLRHCDKLTVKAQKWRNKRSLDANALMWSCLQEIAEKLNADKWNIYLQMLKRYGKFTYIVVKEKAVESMKAQWRECEVVGDVDINGQKGVQMLCYFGSSTYDSKEMTVLLNGIISEMQEMGLQTPPSEEMKRTLEAMERKEKNGQCATEK